MCWDVFGLIIRRRIGEVAMLSAKSCIACDLYVFIVVKSVM